MSLFRSSLVLALIVTFWHVQPENISAHFVPREAAYLYGYCPEIIERLIITIPITLLMNLIYVRTSGSLPAMLLFHSASNTSYFWLAETFDIVRTDFFRVSFLVSMLALTAIMVMLVRKSEHQKEAVKAK